MFAGTLYLFLWFKDGHEFSPNKSLANVNEFTVLTILMPSRN